MKQPVYSNILKTLSSTPGNDLIEDANLSKEERILILDLIFRKYLCDDSINGSPFDNQVIDSLQAIANKYSTEATNPQPPEKDAGMVEVYKEMFPIPNKRTYQLLVSKLDKPCAFPIVFSSKEEAEEAIEAMSKQDVFGFHRLYKP